MATVNAAAVYCRISEDRDGHGAGVKRQEQDCRALAARRGWRVVEVYVDNDVSASTGKSRPAYERLLDDIAAHRVDGVVVWALDRLHRRPDELERFFATCDGAGLRAMASVGGDVDLGTDDGRFHARIMGAVAAKETADKRRRLLRKAQETAANGRVSGGGYRAFGYLADRVTIVPAEAEVIREAARRVLIGEPLRRVCADFDRRGIPTVTGKPWRTPVLRRLLMSARIAGIRSHKGRDVAPAVWPAIITPEEHARLVALLGDPSRNRHGGRLARRNLLSGMSECGACGRKLYSRPRADKAPCYVCISGTNFDGCGKIRRLATPVDELVTEAVFFRLDTPELVTAIQRARADQDAPGVLERLRADEARLESLGRDYGEGVIARTAFLAAQQALMERIDAGRRQLAQAHGVPVLDQLPAGGADALRAVWPSWSVEERRALLGLLVEKVVILPAVKGRNTFDPTKVDIRWKT